MYAVNHLPEGIILWEFHGYHLAVSKDSCEDVIKIMSYSSGQVANSFHFLRLAEYGLYFYIIQAGTELQSNSHKQVEIPLEKRPFTFDVINICKLRMLVNSADFELTNWKSQVYIWVALVDTWDQVHRCG